MCPPPPRLKVTLSPVPIVLMFGENRFVASALTLALAAFEWPDQRMKPAPIVAAIASHDARPMAACLRWRACMDTPR